MTIIASASMSTTTVDLRLVLLALAGARATLVEHGEMDIDQAFDDIAACVAEIGAPEPENPAAAYWNSPSWTEATAEYHRDRKRGRCR